MNIQLQNLIKQLLNIHKLLLEWQRAQYEQKNGAVLNNNEYFNLVVYHADFKWLRTLSEVIALLDEESEQSDISKDKLTSLLVNADMILTIRESEDEFSQNYGQALTENKLMSELVLTARREIQTLLNIK